MDNVVGKVYSVKFPRMGDPASSYYILSFESVGHGTCTVKGNLFGLTSVRNDVPLKLSGKWGVSQKYGGKEFSFHTWEPYASKTDDVKTFLSTCITGFSDWDVVNAVVEKYGTGTYAALTDSPTKVLDEVTTVPRDALEKAVLGWERSLALRDLSLLLKEGGLGAMETQAAMAFFGLSAATSIKENPYRLMEIPGFSFQKVERLALYLGIPPQDIRRSQGVVLWALQEASKQQGHLFLRKGELGYGIRELMQRDKYPAVADTALDNAVVALHKQKAVVLEPGTGVYLNTLHKYERVAAENLSKMLGNTEPLKEDLGPFIDAYQKSYHIELSPAQRTAIETFSRRRVLIITGLPGTGKSANLRALVRLMEESGLNFSLMAPTGIAAKRLAFFTGRDASTIHRALAYDGSEWGLNENNRLLTDAVVVDEASMMDQELFFRLLSALRPETRLVLVGDDAQLPSVGPGNVLRELIDCPEVPHVRLTQIFRQSGKGEIVTNSHKINAGDMPDLDGAVESEFRFIRLPEEKKIADMVVYLASKLKEKDANFQVLSPMYKGLVGVDTLNDRLRDTLNPAGAMEWRKGDLHFRVGDRVMVVQNDYKLGIYNGDVGKLMAVHTGGKEPGLVVKIYGIGTADEEVFFKESTAREKLRLAYAITVHKSQGSEFDNIILPMVPGHGIMLQRNLLYTAVTRAKKKVWLLGDETAIRKAIDNNRVIKRNTGLSKAISGLVGVERTP